MVNPLAGFGGIVEMLTKFGEHRDRPRFKLILPTEGILTIKLLRSGRHPGSVTMEHNGSWIGYIKADTGEYEPSYNARNLIRPTKAEIWDQLKALRADPVAAFEAHGIRTGSCGMCGRTLTNPESIARGIGPICADNAGFGALT